MLEEKNNESIDKVVKFLKNITEIKTILKKSKGVIEINSVLRLFEYETQEKDSGFESESSIQNNNPCLVPTSELIESIEDQSNLDSLLELCLVYICKYLKNIDVSSKKNESIIEEIIPFTRRFIEYLEEIISNIPFRDIIREFLGTMLSSVLADTNNQRFNFTLELIHQFGNLSSLQGNIFDIIIEHLLIFADQIQNAELDASASFDYEIDFRRANDLLFLLTILRNGTNCQFSHKNKEDLVHILETFKDMDDFFSLSFFTLKCILCE